MQPGRILVNINPDHDPVQPLQSVAVTLTGPKGKPLTSSVVSPVDHK